MKTSRQIAFDALFEVFSKKAYSNIAIDAALKGSELSGADRGFAANLFYGVIERKITLQKIALKYIKMPPSKLDKEVLLILKIGIYQLLYMDSVPDSAAVNETVALAGYAKKASAKGLVNAVLRSFLRDDKALPFKKDDLEAAYSCPNALIELWTRQYDFETAAALAEKSLEAPPVSIRVNTIKTTAESLIKSFKEKNLDVRQSEIEENCIHLYKCGDITRLNEFNEGLFHVQDLSSQLCIKALSPKKGEVMLDLCAAPGSKSFTAAEYMEDGGEIYSFDLYEHRIKLIAQGAKRLGLASIMPRVSDALKYDKTIKQADCLLVDAPCSGLGIIRRKPEIKYKPIDEFKSLPKLQLDILTNASKYLKKGGRLIYSTCTTNKEENEDVVLKFLSLNNSFKPLQLFEKLGTIKGNGDFMKTLLPHQIECDGFFFALMQKESN